MKNILHSGKEKIDHLEAFEIFEAISQAFKMLEDTVSSGRFQFFPGRQEMEGLKLKFGELFNSLIKHQDIADLYIESVGYLGKIEINSDSDFGLIKNVYSLLKGYFTSSFTSSISNLSKSSQIEKVIEEEIVLNLAPKENKDYILNVDILTQEEYWTEIGKFFELPVLSEDNCYDIFDEYDFSKLYQENFDLIFQNLRDILKSKKGKQEFRDFLKFLIRTMNDYKKDYLEINQIKDEEKKLKELKTLLEKSFVSGLYCFSNFVTVFEQYQIDYKNVKNISSFAELNNDVNLLNSFNVLRKSFYEQYVQLIENTYVSLLKSSGLGEKNYYSILREISDVLKVYYINMSDERFFIAFKRGFLIGDIYEFLSKKRKEFSSFDENAGEYLIQKIDEYLSK